MQNYYSLAIKEKRFGHQRKCTFIQLFHPSYNSFLNNTFLWMNTLWEGYYQTLMSFAQAAHKTSEHQICSWSCSFVNVSQEKPGVVNSLSPTLRGSKRLSKSNIDVSSPNDVLSGVRHPLIRKQSDSCDADVASGQREVFLSR